MENNNNQKGISQNHSYEKLRKEMKAVKSVGKLLKLAKFLGFKNKELEAVFEQIPDFQNQLEELSMTPEKFNRYYSGLGWVASGSMNFDLMKDAVELAENNEIEKGEELLIKYYSSEEMKLLLTSLLGDEAFRIRYKYFEYAYEDTINKRYYSAIPILLMMIDGATNDVTKSTGFFSDNSDLTLWDTIEGHPSGLTELKKLMNIGGRNKTNFEEISIPFRNGILHGRELDFDNIKVVAKCWAAVFALREWTKNIRNGKQKEEEIEDKAKTPKEQFNSLKDSLKDLSNHNKKMKITREKLDTWEKRTLTVGENILESGKSENYFENTPEKLLVQFFEYWQIKNYGQIAKMINKYDGYNLRKVPSEIRKYLDGKQFKQFKILDIEDTAPAISIINVEVFYIFENIEYQKKLLFRFICIDEKNQASCRGMENCKWTFYEAPLLEIQYSF